MSGNSIKSMPPCPISLKPIQHYLKVAAEHDERDIVIAYWCRLYALQLGLKTDRSSTESKKLLGFLIDWLERTKALHRDNEAIINDIPAQAHLENYAFRLFVWADSQDRAATFNRNVVKAFYTAGLLYDVLETFGEVSEEVQQNKKYAKWKAAYIHNCLKTGETPVPGPAVLEGDMGPSTSTVNFTHPSSLFDACFSALGLPQASISKARFSGEKPTVMNEQEEKKEPQESQEPGTPQESETSQEPETPTDQKRGNSMEARGSIAGYTTYSGIQLSPEQMNKAQKYCKWASSALNYDDVPTAVINLQKALQLLTTGSDD